MKLLFRTLLALLMIISLPGCQAGTLVVPEGLRPENWLPELLGQPTRTPSVSPAPTIEQSPSAPAGTETGPTALTVTPGTPAPTGVVPGEVVLWVPPQFDPNAGTPAGEVLRARLAAFSIEYGAVVQVRVKAPSGPGGLLESLNTAAAAAPLALPGVVALSRADLETAAIKGLVTPLDGMSTVIDDGDWFDYATQLAMVQGATFALPFAGDALVVAFRPGRVVAPPNTWEAAFRLGQPLAIPAGDPQALLVLSLYQGLGGKIEDAQGRPMLQPEVLSQVLQLIGDGEQRGIFPYWLSQYETYAQVWQAYRDERVNALVAWTSDFLQNLPPDTTAVPLPAINGTPQTMVTGWGWAISDPLPERRALSVKLAEYLSESAFLAHWSEAAGYLPTRPSSLAAWTNANLKTLLSPVALTAVARPSNDLLMSQGVVLKEATLKVMKRDSDPTQAAQAAAERLAAPQNR
jgi:ABC-type glycerol-3-phosphate transport system substrate-binding protein